MGALPGADSWQDHPYGFGPNVDGLFAQGNYGIVTKMGFWLMPEPEAYTTAHVSVPRHADIHKLVEVTNFLENSGLIGEPEYASPLAPEGDAPAAPELARLLAKPGGPSAAELDAYATGIGKPVWDVHLQFYGPQKTILANWEYAQEKFSAAIPGASFQQGQMLRFPMTDEQIEAVQMPRKVAIGVPSLAAFSLGARTATNPTPQDGHLWFASIIPKTGEAILKAQSALADVYRRVGMPPERAAFQTPAVFFSRSFIMLVGFPLSRSDRSVNQTSIAAFTQIMEAAAKNGWGEYRAPPLFADKIMNSYSYNDHVLRRFCETLKDSVDPNGILAAGRGGIWPKHLRKDKV
jgi:4-cresol dehydrogenase (hydroxylating)